MDNFLDKDYCLCYSRIAESYRGHPTTSIIESDIEAAAFKKAGTWARKYIRREEVREECLLEAELAIWQARTRANPNASLAYYVKCAIGAMKHWLRTTPIIHIPAKFSDKGIIPVECWTMTELEVEIDIASEDEEL